jgi:hypothetical protein
VASSNSPTHGTALFAATGRQGACAKTHCVSSPCYVRLSGGLAELLAAGADASWGGRVMVQTEHLALAFGTTNRPLAPHQETAHSKHTLGLEGLQG